MIVISNSEIQKYKECKRSWYVTYYLQRAPRAEVVHPVGATWLGTRMHAALEAYYSPELKLSRYDAARVLRDIYMMDIAQWPDAEEDLLAEHDLSHTMLVGYFDWLAETGADQDLTVLATEREILVPFSEEVMIRGRLDSIVWSKHLKAKLFLDHKNVIQFLDEDYLDRDEQAKFYMMLQRLDKGQKDMHVDGGIFNMLRKVKRTAKSKPPYYKRITVRHNSDTLNSMYRRTYQAVNEIIDLRNSLDSGILQEQVAYPTPTRDCVWKCPLASGLCVMMDDGSDWAGYLEEQFALTDPYARYSESGYLDRLEQKGKL